MFLYNKFMTWLEKIDKETPHISKYHKESLYEHTILAASSAACRNSCRPLFIAALLHDVGKPETLVVHPEKGATFHDHQNHIDIINEFLTEDDIHYKLVCDLIKLHMLPYTLSGPEPWRSYAEKQMIEVIHNNDSLFVSYLFMLHNFDMRATFSDSAPSENTIKNARNVIDVYSNEISNTK